MIIEENTDVDAILIKFGGGVTNKYYFSDQKKQEFQAFRVIPESDPNTTSKYQYRIQRD